MIVALGGGKGLSSTVRALKRKGFEFAAVVEVREGSEKFTAYLLLET